MSLTFYFAPNSTATITSLVLEELGTPHEKVQLSFDDKGTKKPDFLKLNPNGRVPTIVHYGTPIGERLRSPMTPGGSWVTKPKLGGLAGPKRGELMKWVVWNDRSTLARRCTPAGVQHHVGARGSAAYRQGLRGRGRRHPEGALRAPAPRCSKGMQYLTGYYTLADTHVSLFIDWLNDIRHPHEVVLEPHGLEQAMRGARPRCSVA